MLEVMATCTVRILDADDWAVWREVRLRSLADAPDAFGAKLADWQGADEDRWRTRFANVEFNGVAVVDASVVGTVGGLRHTFDTVELVSMWVAPEVRGTGVGEALIDAVVRWSGPRAVERITLEVRNGNRRAAALYERAGFVRVGPNPDDASETTMVRDLDVVIRAATPDDADAVAACHRRCFAVTYAAQLRSGALEAPDPDGVTRQLQSWFGPDSGFHTEVVIADGMQIAHATTSGSQLVHLFVDPDHQAEGWGQRLLARAEAKLAAGGHRTFELHARTDNPSAIAFYEAAGWTTTARLVHTDEHGISYDERVLVKRSPVVSHEV